MLSELLNGSDRHRAGAFVALFNLEFNSVPFVEGLKAITDNAGVMDKKVRSIVM